MPTIAFLAFPDVQSLDLTGPMDVFSEANRFLEPSSHYQLRIIGTKPGLLTCSNGLVIQPHATYNEFCEPVDLLMVAGGPTLSHWPKDGALCQWLCTMNERCSKIAAVCNGAFLLAHAGLLDGLQVTTHWNDARKLAYRFPGISVQADRIFLRAGRVYTSAGVTAGIDLALYLLFEDFGADVSLNVAKRLVVASQRNGGQSQFSPYLVAYVSSASNVQPIRQYVIDHLAESLSVEKLAKAAAMSQRNFARVFTKEAKMTPKEFVERVRVDAARVLLETSTQPLKAIAHSCGFGTTSRMRAAFLKSLNVTAQQYRMNFGAGPNRSHT